MVEDLVLCGQVLDPLDHYISDIERIKGMFEEKRRRQVTRLWC